MVVNIIVPAYSRSLRSSSRATLPMPSYGYYLHFMVILQAAAVSYKTTIRNMYYNPVYVSSRAPCACVPRPLQHAISPIVMYMKKNNAILFFYKRNQLTVDIKTKPSFTIIIINPSSFLSYILSHLYLRTCIEPCSTVLKFFYVSALFLLIIILIICFFKYIHLWPVLWLNLWIETMYDKKH